MPEKLKKLSEDTLIPVSFMVVLAGGIFWLSSMYSEVKANTTSVDELKKTNEAYMKTVQSIDTRLSRIEGKLGVNGEK